MKRLTGMLQTPAPGQLEGRLTVIASNLLLDAGCNHERDLNYTRLTAAYEAAGSPGLISVDEIWYTIDGQVFLAWLQKNLERVVNTPEEQEQMTQVEAAETEVDYPV
jgi:hypothetical protein